MQGTPARGEDWREYIDTILAPGGAMARLDSAVAIVERSLGRRGQLYDVAIMIPYSNYQMDTLRYQGTLYTLGEPRSGAALVAAYVSDVKTGFRARGFQHVSLRAFYWLHESIEGTDTAVVPEVAKRVHAEGFQFLWIPFFDAPGWRRWQALGFDYAWLQPNYFIVLALPALRVDSAIARARAFGMGIELEFDRRLLSSTAQYEDRLGTYLSRLRAAPDLRTLAVYDGAGALIVLSRAPDWWSQCLYRRIVDVLTSGDSSVAH